jgi:septal ring factor EnvC (AmiA/AmiB activator)
MVINNYLDYYFLFLIIWKLEDAAKMDLNEWGDFLAGFAAPLMLLWLIIGYRLQKNELTMNTEALREQQKELARQVDELSKQNTLMQSLVEALESLPNAIGKLSDAITTASFQKPF